MVPLSQAYIRAGHSQDAVWVAESSQWWSSGCVSELECPGAVVLSHLAHT